MRFIITAITLLLASTATAGPHTDTRWSTSPDGEGQPCDLSRFSVCYYNWTGLNDSPLLLGPADVFQSKIRFIVVSGTTQADIEDCDAGGPADATGTRTAVRDCSDLFNGANLTTTTNGNTSLAPDGGVMTAVKVNVETCSSCEGEVEVKIGGAR